MTPTELKQARSDLGLSQRALAAHIGRSLSIVQKWEGGAAEVDALAARYVAALMATDWRPDDWPG